MIKLLLLAILGLALGGGVWKARNPDGTLDQLKTEAMTSVERLQAGVQSGVNAVVSYPEALKVENDIDSRLATLEERIGESPQPLHSQELQSIVDQKLAENANSLSDLQASLDDQAVPMESITGAVAELDTALQDTRARTDAGNVRLDAIDRRLQLLVRRLDEETTETDITALNQVVETLQERTDTLQSASDDEQREMQEALAELEEQNDSLALRLDSLLSVTESGVANAAIGSADSDDNPADTQASTGSDFATGFTGGMDRRLAAIEQRLATVNADSRRIANLSLELEAARLQIIELEQQNVQANESIAQLNDSVDALTTENESLSIDTIQAQVQDQLALAQSQFDANETNADSTNTTQLEALLETTRDRIQTLEQRVQGLPAASSEADDALLTQSVLQSQIADLERRLEGLTSSDPALQDTVNDVKEQVEQLSAQGFVTQDELRATTESESRSIEYKIYFDRNSIDITEEAAQVLDSFIAQEKNRTTGVSIFGFTDRSGSAAYNQQLALQRATNVRSYLIQNGLDFTKIRTLSGLGEDAAAAVLPDDAADAQQRVVVLFAAQP